MATPTKRKPGLPRCSVVGTSFSGRATTIVKHCHEGKNVSLSREPNNPHDPNAVSVWVEVPGFFSNKNKMIGHLKRAHAKRIAKVLDDDYQLWAQIDEIYISDNPEVAPNVKLNVGYVSDSADAV